MINSRIISLYNQISGYSLEALLVTYPANVSYLCQYQIADTYLLISPKENFLITDFRYIEEAQLNIRGFTVKETTGSIFKLVSSLIMELGVKQAGFEAKYLPFGEYQKIKEGLGAETKLIPAYDLVENLRIIKDKTETAKIESAVKLTEEAFIFLKDVIKPGVREIDVSAELNRFIRMQGADTASFEAIVASGPNSSMPHHKTGQKIINNNEPVLVDIGVEISGYKSDLTRMFFLGKMPDAVKKAEEVVFAAKSKAISLLKPGVPIKDIDSAARQYIANFGWSKNFGHSLGHGVGIEVHEDPHINRKNETLLQAGMVFTLEPAVYFPKQFGIRLEDMALITEKGANVLNGTLDKRM